MNTFIKGRLTVYFECPYWVAVFEKQFEGKLQTCRVVLGTSEPKDNEIYNFILSEYYNLEFSKAVSVEENIKPKIKNPKRMQREVSKSITKNGISTKSQEVMRLAREENKLQRKRINRQEKLQFEKKKYLKKQIKKKDKKRGH